MRDCVYTDRSRERSRDKRDRERDERERERAGRDRDRDRERVVWVPVGRGVERPLDPTKDGRYLRKCEREALEQQKAEKEARLKERERLQRERVEKEGKTDRSRSPPRATGSTIAEELPRERTNQF